MAACYFVQEAGGRFTLEDDSGALLLEVCDVLVVAVTSGRGRKSAVSEKGALARTTLGGAGVTDIVSILGRSVNPLLVGRSRVSSTVGRYAIGFAVLSGRGKGAGLPDLHLVWVDLWLDQLPRVVVLFDLPMVWVDLWLDQLPRVVVLFDLPIDLERHGEAGQTH